MRPLLSLRIGSVKLGQLSFVTTWPFLEKAIQNNGLCLVMAITFRERMVSNELSNYSNESFTYTFMGDYFQAISVALIGVRLHLAPVWAGTKSSTLRLRVCIFS